MKIGFIGGGNMGEAIVRAILEQQITAPADITAADVAAPRRAYLKDKYGIYVTDDNAAAVAGKDIIVMAVKPQQIKDVLAGLKGRLKADQTVVSIAAGVTVAAITGGLAHRRVVRVMPNTPAQIGLGISGWTATAEVSAAQKAEVRRLLASMGKEIYFDDESYLDMVTAVSGSGPAYLYLFAESLIEAAVDLGLSRDDARALVLQTVLGAANLMVKSDKAPAELRREVTSKGGTTERALAVFEETNFAATVRRAVRAACDRAKELGQS